MDLEPTTASRSAVPNAVYYSAVPMYNFLDPYTYWYTRYNFFPDDLVTNFCLLDFEKKHAVEPSPSEYAKPLCDLAS